MWQRKLLGFRPVVDRRRTFVPKSRRQQKLKPKTATKRKKREHVSAFGFLSLTPSVLALVWLDVSLQSPRRTH